MVRGIYVEERTYWTVSRGWGTTGKSLSDWEDVGCLGIQRFRSGKWEVWVIDIIYGF